MLNIVYSIDSNTGQMKLKLRDGLLDSMDKSDRDSFLNYILPILSMNNKLLLTGSLSLKLLGFEPLDKVGDFDFALQDNFTEEDYLAIKSFFNMHPTYYSTDYDGNGNGTVVDKFDPKARMWQLFKEWGSETDNPDVIKSNFFKLDIFNDEIIRKKDIITFYYDDFEIRCVHPSVTWSYRTRYALDIRSGSAFKYWERLDKFMKDAKSFYNLLRSIQNMIMRVADHNANIENNKNKLSRLRALIEKREYNMEEFFKKVFEISDGIFNDIK